MIENKKPVNFYKNLSEITEKAIKEIQKQTNYPTEEFIISICDKYGLNFNKISLILDKKY